MSDEQVQALMQTWRDALVRQMDDMRVRQWCVEQSLKYAATMPGRVDPKAFGELCDAMLKFITAPFAETFKD